MRVERRFAKGFTLLGALTAAKSINDTSQDGVGPGTGIQDPTNLRLERSLDPQDVSRRLVVSGVWELPIGRTKALGTNWPRALDLIAGGWQISGIASFQSGYPLVMSSTGAARPNRVSKGEPVSGPIQRNLARAFDTSAFAVPAAFTYGNSSRTAPDPRTHGVSNFDLSLFKYFDLVERVRAQLRFEAFNTFNRVQFAAPGTQAGTTGFRSDYRAGEYAPAVAGGSEDSFLRRRRVQVLDFSKACSAYRPLPWAHGTRFLAVIG